MQRLRILAILVLGLSITMVFCSCSLQGGNVPEQERFVEVSYGPYTRVFVDKETNVEWLYDRGNGTFQVLIDKDGYPRVHK